MLTVAAISAGCRTVPSLPPADLSASGWRVQQGQAVWKPDQRRPELAGELLLATNAIGDCFVQFSKPPFTLATARLHDGHWQIEFGTGEHIWRGAGQPPPRFVWFQLPRALTGNSLKPDWNLQRREGNTWRLENARTGESLEGGFFP